MEKCELNYKKIMKKNVRDLGLFAKIMANVNV